MGRQNLATWDHAVSETLGYILIFGIITACIAMVFLIGNQIIGQTQSNANFQSAEQSFEVINSDLSRTAFEASPAMSTRVRIDSGSLSMLPAGDSGSVIEIDYNGGDNHSLTKFGRLVYDSNIYGQNISLEDGALMKMYGADGEHGAIMTLRPKIYYSAPSKTLYIAIVNLTGDMAAVGGGYITDIRSSFVDSSFKSYDKKAGTNDTAYVSIRTNYPGAWSNYWEDYFKSTFGTGPLAVSLEPVAGPDSARWVTAELDGVNKLVVVTYTVNIKM